MKKWLLAVCFSIGASASLMAGADIIIKNRAKELSNQNNVRQGVTPPSAPAPSAVAKPAAATPQQTASSRLLADLAALKAGTPATAAQKQQIARDLALCASGAAKPSSGTVTKLAEDVSAVASAVPAAERSRLVQDLTAVLNAGNYQATQMEAITSDVQAIFQANGVPRSAAVGVANDAKAVAAEIQKGGAH